MHRILAVLLFCAGIFCLAQSNAQVPMTGAGLGAPSSGGINNTALDGAVNTSATCPLVMPGLTTTAAGLVIVFMEVNGGTGIGATAVGSSLGSFTQRANTGTGLGAANSIIEFFAVSSAAVTSEVITITVTSSPGGFCEATAFGVKGVKTGTNNGFDANGGLPVVSVTSPISVSTSNANDFLIVGSRNGTDVGPPTPGWTDIITGSFLMTAFKKVTSPQSSLSVADPAGSSNGIIGDALVSN